MYVSKVGPTSSSASRNGRLCKIHAGSVPIANPGPFPGLVSPLQLHGSTYLIASGKKYI